MNYAKIAFDKVTSLESYTSTLAKRISKNTANTVVFSQQNKPLVQSNNIFDIEFDTSTQTTLLVDVFATISGLNGSVSTMVSQQGMFTQSQNYVSNGMCCFRMVFDFAAQAGANLLSLTLSPTQACNLNSMVVVISGQNLLNKSISLVSGSFNPTYQQWTLGEARNNLFFITDANLSTKTLLKDFQGKIDRFLMHRINNTSFAFVVVGGILISITANALANTSKIASSVSDIAIGQSGQNFTMFVVCRSRLYCAEVSDQQTKLLLSQMSLHNQEKINAVRCTPFDQDRFILCVETTTKIFVYLCDGQQFQLLTSFSARGINCCFAQNDTVFVIFSSGNVSTLQKYDIQTGILQSPINLGSFDSIFQYTQTSALASKDNVLMTISLQ